MDLAGGRGKRASMEKTLTENLTGILKRHGYENPVFCGKGSFSTVYRVRDEKGHFLACKIAEDCAQWRRECDIWQEIRHPRFPSYREHWTEEKVGYLIMDYWEGMDLRKMLERRGRLTVAQTVRIADQVAEGLQYLHERPHPYLYRDLKPENIRIRADGSVGIMDLGCLWNAKQEWSGAGNYTYSAPEQFVPGEIPGEESDVYAVGRLLAVMSENIPKKYGKRNSRLKWLRRLVVMATEEERKERIPDMRTFRRLLRAMDAPRRVRRHVMEAADFYFVRKVHYP